MTDTTNSTLSGVITLITGAANGIGLAAAEALARAGAIVELCDRDKEALNRVIERMQAAGLTVHGTPCDVASTHEVDAWVSACLERRGRIDILINNAAVAIPGNITAMSEEDWTTVINTNLTSAFRTIKAALPTMLEQGKGSVVNISSTQGHRSWNDWTAYATAKGGLLAMTRQLAGQFGPQGIRFNSISPGAINTPMNEERFKNEGQAFLNASQRMHALRRIGESSEVANAILFLASDNASFITGQDLLVDGGLSVLPCYFEDR